MLAKAKQGPFPFEVSFCAPKGQQKEGHIVDEHDLIVGMEDQRPCQQKYQAASQADPQRDSSPSQPCVHQKYGCDQTQDLNRHQVICHFYERQQIRRQNQRTQQSVIRKVINVLSRAQISRKLREQLSGLIKLFPKIIRKDAVLALPPAPLPAPFPALYFAESFALQFAFWVAYCFAFRFVFRLFSLSASSPALSFSQPHRLLRPNPVR